MAHCVNVGWLGLGCVVLLALSGGCGETDGEKLPPCSLEGGADSSSAGGAAAGSGDLEMPAADAGMGGALEPGMGGVASQATGGIGTEVAGGMPGSEGGKAPGGGPGIDTGGSEGGVGGEGGAAINPILGGPFPGTPPSPDAVERYALGYYYEDALNGYLCLLNPNESPYCVQYGSPGSRPYVIGGAPPCVTHGNPRTEFAGFGTVLGSYWYSSPNDFYWQPGLDYKYNGQQGAAAWPAIWNGVLTSFELDATAVGPDPAGVFTVDWERNYWQTSEGVVKLPFAPEGLDENARILPVIGRWRDGYGQRLGIYNAGMFYLDWDGDNAWDSEKDKVAQFGTADMYPVAADFAPGGADEIATYADGYWYVDLNGNFAWDGHGTGDYILAFGAPGTLPAVSRDLWLRYCDDP